MLRKKNISVKISLAILLLMAVVVISGCTGGISFGYKYTVAGRVVDLDFRPVDNAQVRLNNTDKIDITDGEGYFTLYNVPAGNNYILEAENYLYSNAIEIDVTEDKYNVIIVLGDLGTANVEGTVNLFNQTSGEYYAISSMQQNNEIEPYSVKERSDYVEGEILIKYSDTVSTGSISSMATERKLSKMSSISTEKGRIVRYRIPADKTVEEMITYYNGRPEIEWAEPNYLRYASSYIPNDPKYGYTQDKQWGHSAVNLEAAWDIERGENVVKVAVIDSGVLTDHPDLNYHLNDYGVDFVGGSDEFYPGDPENYQPTDYNPVDESPDSSHGTHIAGIIGAETNNGTGVAGVNWNIDILPIRVMDAWGAVSVYDECEGIYYAIDQHVDIINLGFGYNTESNMESDAIAAAMAENIIVVAPAGNDGLNDIYYPAACDGVIAVGAVYENIYDEIEHVYFSNYGSELDLVAPGASIWSTSGYYDYGQVFGYESKNGTSMATAYVSGAAALLLADGVSKSAVYDRLTDTAVDLNAQGWDEKTGYGLIDIYGALLNRRLTPPKIFAGEEEEIFGELYLSLKSEITEPDGDGNYELQQVEAGSSYIYGWRDVNLDGEINKGDYFGKTENQIDLSYYNNLYDVDFDIYYISDQINSTGVSSIKVIEE